MIMIMIRNLREKLLEMNAPAWDFNKKVSFIIEAVTTQNPSQNRLELTASLAKFLLEEEPDFSEGSEIFYLMSLFSRIK